MRSREISASSTRSSAISADSTSDLLQRPPLDPFPLGRLIERINGEIKRRTNVVGIFPNDASILRLVSAVPVETYDEWAVAERRFFSEESPTKIAELNPAVAEATAITA